jgi:hypothetical protein
MRPGEKLYEELFIPGERYIQTDHKKVLIAGNASSFVPDDLDTSIAVLEHAARRNDQVTILQELRRLIPEFRPPGATPVDKELRVASGFVKQPLWDPTISEDALTQQRYACSNRTPGMGGCSWFAIRS